MAGAFPRPPPRPTGSFQRQPPSRPEPRLVSGGATGGGAQRARPQTSGGGDCTSPREQLPCLPVAPGSAPTPHRVGVEPDGGLPLYTEHRNRPPPGPPMPRDQPALATPNAEHLPAPLHRPAAAQRPPSMRRSTALQRSEARGRPVPRPIQAGDRPAPLFSPRSGAVHRDPSPAAADSVSSELSARWAEWDDEAKKLTSPPVRKGSKGSKRGRRTSWSPDRSRDPGTRNAAGGRWRVWKAKAGATWTRQSRDTPQRRTERRHNDHQKLVKPDIAPPQERWKALDHGDESPAGSPGSPTSCRKCRERLQAARQQLRQCADELWQAQLQLVSMREEVKAMRRVLAKRRGANKRTLPPAQWDWLSPAILDGDEDTWFPYPADDAALLEQVFPAGTFDTRDLTFNLRDCLYHFDFAKMVQTNTETGEDRKMRRRVPTPPPQQRAKPLQLDEVFESPTGRAVPGDASVKIFASLLRSPVRNRSGTLQRKGPAAAEPQQQAQQQQPVQQQQQQQLRDAKLLMQLAGQEWTEEKQADATELLVDWVQAAQVGSWTFAREEFKRFSKYLCPTFEVPPVDRIGIGETFIKLFTEVLRESQRKEGDKATVTVALDALVEACDPGVLQRTIKKWLEVRGATVASNEGELPKYGDGIADAKAPEDVKTVSFYDDGYRPPTNVQQTVDNLSTWHTPQGRVWGNADIERFRGNCQLMNQQHSADQSPEVVLPLYLYSVSLYRIVLWAVWISPKRAPPRGKWATVRNTSLDDSHAQWERVQRLEQIIESDVDNFYQARRRDIRDMEDGMDDQVYSSLMEKARLDAERFRQTRIEECAVDRQDFFLKLSQKWFDGISGAYVPDNGLATHIKIDWIQKLQQDMWFKDTFCIVRFDNKKRGQAKWSPCHDTTAWLPPYEVMGPTKQEAPKQAPKPIKPFPAAGWGKLKKAVATATVSGAVTETIKVSPEQQFRNTVDKLPPPGILDYIHSRRSEEHLRWALPVWECRPAVNRVARKLIDKCYTVADQQKHDPGLEKEFRGILKQDKLLMVDHLAQVMAGIPDMMRKLADVKCDPGNPATPQLIAHAMDIQYLRWEEQHFLLSLSGSRFLILDCGAEKVVELSRVKDGHDDQPYWHLNYAMRMFQQGRQKTVLTVAGSTVPGKYVPPPAPSGAPDRSDLAWQLPCDLLHEKKKGQRIRWDPHGGELSQGCWRAYPEGKLESGVPLDAKDCNFELCTWMLGQLTPLIWHTDRAMVQLRHVSDAKVGYSVCPPPRGIKNYRGLANVSLPASVYSQGKVVLWGQYSSSTTDRGVASAFAGGASACAVFNLVGKSCRCIAQWSRFAREKEWLYPPGVKFRVVSALTEEQQQILGRQNLQLFSMEEIDEFEALEIYVRRVVPTVAGGDGGAEQVMQLFRIMHSLTSHKADDALVRALDPLSGTLYTEAGQYIVRCLVTRMHAATGAFHNALHVAATGGIVEAVPLLLDSSPEPRLGAKADVTARTPHGHTPLHLAVLGGHLPMVKQLLMARGRPMMLGLGFVPLEYAAMKRDYEMVRLLRPVTHGCGVPQRLADYQPQVTVIEDKEILKKEVQAANIPWDDAKAKHCKKQATVTLFDNSSRADLAVFWLKFAGGQADKLPVTTFKQAQRRSRGALGDSSMPEALEPEPGPTPTGLSPQLSEQKEEKFKEDFNLFNLRTHVDVEMAGTVYKYVIDNGIASLVSDAVQQLVTQLPETAPRFFRDYFQEKMGLAPMPVKDHKFGSTESASIVYLSYQNAQLPPHQKLPVANTLTNPVERVTQFCNFAVRSRAPIGADGEAEVQEFFPASCDVRYMFPIQKRLSHIFLNLIGRRTLPFTSGSRRESAQDVVYHIPRILFRGRDTETNLALYFRDPGKEIVLSASIIEEVAAAQRKAGVTDTVYNESFPGEPVGPPAGKIWGPGEFRITGEELQELEATTRIATTAALPPRLFCELAGMASDPKYVWFFSLCRAVPLSAIEDKQQWAPLREMYERRIAVEQPQIEDLELERRRACAQINAEKQQHLDLLGSIDFQLEQHRLWLENSAQHLSYLARERDMQSIANKFAEWRQAVIAAPRDYSFDTADQVRVIFDQSLTELCSCVTISQQGYSFTRGVDGASNQISPMTPQPITFISAAGIDFNTPTATLIEAPKYFMRSQQQLGPDVPEYEGWCGWKRGAQERLLERLKDMYRIIFESAQHHGVQNLSMLPMGLGVFLLNVNEYDKDKVRELYFRAQFELLSEREYGFENYYINAGKYGQKARETLEDGMGDGKGGIYNDPQRGRFLRCNVVFHDRDAKFLAVELARYKMSPALLNPCDCSGLFLGQIGNYWETGRAMYYMGEEDLGATTTLLLGHSGISDCLQRAGCIIHEGSRTVSRPARPQRKARNRPKAKPEGAAKEPDSALNAGAEALQPGRRQLTVETFGRENTNRTPLSQSSCSTGASPDVPKAAAAPASIALGVPALMPASSAALGNVT